MGDVRGGGSSTPSMVAAINKFRREQPERAGPLWERIIALNDATARAMAPPLPPPFVLIGHAASLTPY